MVYKEETRKIEIDKKTKRKIGNGKRVSCHDLASSVNLCRVRPLSIIRHKIPPIQEDRI